MHSQSQPNNNNSAKLLTFPGIGKVGPELELRQEKSLTAPAKNRPEKPARMEELEAYRGLAALLIVVYHAYQHSRIGTTYVYENTPFHFILRNLEGGVALFFGLSGFLIFLPFARAALGQSQPLSLRGFLVRRAIRIFPLYYLVILVVWNFRFFGSQDQWTDLWRHLTFTHIFDSKYIFWTVGPAWSLAVEVIFYLFIAAFGPLIYWLCSKLSRVWQRVSLLTGLVVLLTLVSLGYKWWAFFVARIPEEDYSTYFGPLAKLDNFALGMFLAVIVAVVGNRRLHLIWSNLLRLAGIGTLLVLFYYRETNPVLNLYFHTLCSLSFTLVLASTVLGPHKSLWKSILAHPALQFLGVISYSVYLWHEPLLIELADTHTLFFFKDPFSFPWHALALVLCTCLVGALSYWGLEYPTMQLRYLFNSKGRLFNRYSTTTTTSED